MIEGTSHITQSRIGSITFADVARILSRYEIEDLLTQVFEPEQAGPFVVEGIEAGDNGTEVEIRFMGTLTRRKIILKKAVDMSEVLEKAQ